MKKMLSSKNIEIFYSKTLKCGDLNAIYALMGCNLQQPFQVNLIIRRI